MVDRCFGEDKYYGVALLWRTVDEIILTKAFAHCLARIGIT